MSLKCEKCGFEPESINCPACGEPAPRWASFCPYCGAALPGSADETMADRRLCPDGNCIGILGLDGRCVVCGRSG